MIDRLATCCFLTLRFGCWRICCALLFEEQADGGAGLRVKKEGLRHFVRFRLTARAVNVDPAYYYCWVREGACGR